MLLTSLSWVDRETNTTLFYDAIPADRSCGRISRTAVRISCKITAGLRTLLPDGRMRLIGQNWKYRRMQQSTCIHLSKEIH